MELITRAELARRIGVSPPSINKAIKAKKLRLVGEGRGAKVDFHDHLTQKYKEDVSSNRIVGKQISTNEDQEEPKENQDNTNDPFAESNQLRDQKAKLQIQKLQVEHAEKVGQLILKKEVDAAFNKISSAILSYIHPLSDRLAPILSGIFESTDQEKVNEVKTTVDKEVGRALDAVKKEISDSLLEL